MQRHALNAKQLQRAVKLCRAARYRRVAEMFGKSGPVLGNSASILSNSLPNRSIETVRRFSFENT